MTSSTLTEGVTVRNPEATRADPSQPDPARFRVGLVAPLPPQVGGVTSIAEWLLARQDLIGCCYQPFDLFRPANGGAGGRLRSSSVLRQIVLMLHFFRNSNAYLPMLVLLGLSAGLASERLQARRSAPSTVESP